ncbi:MAG: pilin [Candidatus Doudnabacteria bacterium]
MKKLLPVFLLILLIVPLMAFAQTNPPCQISSGGTTTPSELPRCINQIYVWALGLSALLAMMMFVIGGYYYMTASGNAEQTSKGVEMIWSAVIGMGLLFGAYLLLNTINPDLVKFNVDSLNGLNQTPGTTVPSGTTPPIRTGPTTNP